MLIRRAGSLRPAPRRGVTLVECALLLTIFLLFLFGVFEYGRYLLTMHVTTNAAREGVRYAVVNVNQPFNFDMVDTSPVMYDSLGNPLISINNYTRGKMGGVNGMITGFTVETFPCTTTLLYDDPPVFTPKPGWSNNPATRTVQWNAATFSERIAVRITGTYQPILPNFLWMQNASTVNVVAVMGSEG